MKRDYQSRVNTILEMRRRGKRVIERGKRGDVLRETGVASRRKWVRGKRFENEELKGTTRKVAESFRLTVGGLGVQSRCQGVESLKDDRVNPNDR